MVHIVLCNYEERERVVSKRFFERLAVEALDNYIDDESGLIDSNGLKLFHKRSYSISEAIP